MAFGRDTTAEHIKPLNGHISRRYVAGATVAAGEIVSMQADGYVDPSNCTSAADPPVGVAVQAGVAGDTLDVVVFGPVVCLTDGTKGAAVYNSTTAGEPAASQSGNNQIVGWAESATILFVNPER